MIGSEAELKVRNPKNPDLGDVVPLQDEEQKDYELENLHLYDGKEFYVQPVDSEHFVS